jgi:CheY-like chemotaxis protein
VEVVGEEGPQKILQIAIDPPPGPAVASKPKKVPLRRARAIGGADKDMRFSRNVHVLVVEDNAVNAKVVSKVLERLNCTCKVVVDGEEALTEMTRVYANLNDDPTLREYTLILMDLNMPKLNGWQATATIRELELVQKLPPIPIVALTAAATPENRVKCTQVGMNDIIAKPISKKMLFDCIQKFYIIQYQHLDVTPSGLIVPSSRTSSVPSVMDPLPDPNLASRRPVA